MSVAGVEPPWAADMQRLTAVASGIPDRILKHPPAETPTLALVAAEVPRGRKIPPTTRRDRVLRPRGRTLA